MILFQTGAAFLAGVAAAALGFGECWPALILVGGGVAGALVVAKRRGEALLVAVLALAALAGLDRYEETVPPSGPGGLALLNDRMDQEGRPVDVTLRGVIVDEPEEGETTRRFTVKMSEYRDGDGVWQTVTGRLLVTARLYPAREYGEGVELTGHLETPPRLDDFDYREYLARRGIISTLLYPTITVLGTGAGDGLQRWLYAARRPFAAALERALPEPESALARGILLGERAAIPKGLNEDFNRSGIAHLIAISGQNVVLVAGFVVASFAALIGRRPATGLAIAVVWAYAFFVGGSPSVLRAGIMATVMLGAEVAGRPGRGLSALVFTAAVMVGLQPQLADDVAFQLSFAACLGILLAAQRLQSLVLPAFARLPSWLGAPLAGNLAITAAAGLAVLPVIAGTFGRISLVALPANLVAGPAFVLALLGSAATACAGVVHPELGRASGEVAYLPLTFLVRLGDFAARLPAASLEVSAFGAGETLVSYALLAVGFVYLRRQAPPEAEPAFAASQPLRPVLAGAGALVVAAAAVWWGVLTPDAGRLRVTVLDVGQGDAILIETPAGHRVLVDGGPSGARLSQALGRVLPASERRIDLIVLTHAQDDHVTGFIQLLQRYDVGAALTGPTEGSTGAYQAWLQELELGHVPVMVVTAGQVIDFGGGVTAEVLGPPPGSLTGTRDDVNNNSVVLRVLHGSVSFLLTGDLAAEGEMALLDSGAPLRSTVLKVGHHGSDGSTTSAFVEAVAPGIAVISTGDENTFGHPSPSTRLRLSGIPLLRTDLNGDVRFETNGSALWVSAGGGAGSRMYVASER